MMALRTARPLVRSVRRRSRRIDTDVIVGYVEAVNKTLEFETELTGSRA